jgi:hypothetical protein
MSNLIPSLETFAKAGRLVLFRFSYQSAGAPRAESSSCFGFVACGILWLIVWLLYHRARLRRPRVWARWVSILRY